MDLLCTALIDATIQFRVLDRAVQLAEPCVGLSGYRELASVCKLPYATVAYDTDHRLHPFHAARNLSANCKLNIGESNGNLLEIDLRSGVLDGTEGLIAGPPCQHLNESGGRLGIRDERSLVFDTVLDWVVYLAWKGDLFFFFAIENSANIQRVTDMHKELYETWVLRKVNTLVPFFTAGVSILCAYPTLPHMRTRWWLRALRDPVPQPNLLTS